MHTQQQRELANTLHATARVRTGNGYQEFPGWHPARNIGTIHPYATDMTMPVGTAITSGSGLGRGIVSQLEAIHNIQQQTHFRDATRQTRRPGNSAIAAAQQQRQTRQQQNVPESALESLTVYEGLDTECVMCCQAFNQGDRVCRVTCIHGFHTISYK